MKKSIFLSAVLTLLLFTFAKAQSINGNNVVVTAATESCIPYMNEFNKFGNYGTEVAKLQLFLNENNGANLNGLGYFGPVTQQEVKNFQYTYGIKPTGYQHIKTTQMINDIVCGKVAKLPRKVYLSTNIYHSYVGGQTYVNKNNGNLVKDYSSKTIPTLIGSTTNLTDASTTNFWANLKKDWGKIQENYKAYLLVFALVVALFWFLRKAATE